MVCFYYLFFFFFKQKTAYEMRISDWSSDVCSSDLQQAAHQDQRHDDRGSLVIDVVRLGGQQLRGEGDQHRIAVGSGGADGLQRVHIRRAAQEGGKALDREPPTRPEHHAACQHEVERSEEHTSELQSLMRISYADFCLKQ